MSWLIEQVFIALLSFSKSLATKCVSLNNEPSKNWPTLIDLNPVEFRYWPFMISLHKCSGSCNSVDHLSTKICVPSKTKDINFKVCEMLTNKIEAKTMVKNITCDCKYKFDSATCNSNKKWNNETCQC